MNVIEIIEKSKVIEIKLNDPSKIDFPKLLKIISVTNGNVYLLGKNPNSIFIKVTDDEMVLQEKEEFIKDILLKIKSK